jgi:hypothetical protein
MKHLYIGLYSYPEKYTNDANLIAVMIILLGRNNTPSRVNNMHFQSKPEKLQIVILVTRIIFYCSIGDERLVL